MSGREKPSSEARKRKLPGGFSLKNARRWHRWLGLLLALPLLWLAVSGLLLNHAEFLGLNERRVTTAWVLSRYLELPEEEPLGLQAGSRQVVQWGEVILLDGEALDLPGDLVGAVAYRDRLLVATGEKVIGLDGSGEVVVEHDELSLPELPLEQIWVSDGRVYLRSGKKNLQLDESLYEVRAADAVDVPALVKPTVLPDTAREAFVKQWREDHYMSASRVLLDAHSGKLFGKAGVFLNDLVVLGLVVLTLAGLRLLWRRK